MEKLVLSFCKSNLTSKTVKSSFGPNGTKIFKKNFSTDKNTVSETKEYDIATVFGATGNIGRNVVSFLARSNAQVITPFRGEERHAAYLRVAGDVGQIAPLRWEIYDQKATDVATAQSNIVVNACGKNHPTKKFSFEDANLDSTKQIVKTAKRNGVKKYIHISAVGVDDLNNKSEFLKSKREAEEVVRDVFPEATILRITTPFGERDRFFHRFGYMVANSPVYLQMHDPKKLVQPVLSIDVARAVIAAINDPHAMGKTYELGGKDILSWEEFADFVLKATKYDKGLKTIFSIEPNSYAAKTIAKVLDYTRHKIYTSDELLYYQTDNVVSSAPGTLTFKDLKIEPEGLMAAINVFQLYQSKLRSREKLTSNPI